MESLPEADMPRDMMGLALLAISATLISSRQQLLIYATQLLASVRVAEYIGV
jgi:hypothetical protein